MKRTYGLLGLGILLGIFLAMMALMRVTAAGVAQLSGGQGIIDLTFAVTPSQIGQALAGYNDAARAYYQWAFYSVDMVYAMAYCTFYRCAIKSVCERCGLNCKVGELLPMLPIVGAAADLLENTVMFILLSGGRAEALMWAFTVLNVIKFVFVYSSLAIVVGGALWLIKKRLS